MERTEKEDETNVEEEMFEFLFVFHYFELFGDEVITSVDGTENERNESSHLNQRRILVITISVDNRWSIELSFKRLHHTCR